MRMQPFDAMVRLRDNMRYADYCSYDPYDGLNSSLFGMLKLDCVPFFRLAWIQLFKRLPINLRPLAGVQTTFNPKTGALVVLGLLNELERHRDERLVAEAVALGDRLLSAACNRATWKHYCWGYPFAWQARAFYVPIGTPNLIATVYVARALWALFEFTAEGRYAEAAIDAARFVSAKLWVAEGKERGYVAYIPGRNVLVHNANLWGAALMALGAQQAGARQLAELAYSAIQRTVDAQREDGSWPYGTRSHHQFVDSFHTGYNLEALGLARSCLGTTEWNTALERGLVFYREHFFLSDGTPKYYHDAIYPIDMHCAAQGVITLLRIGGTVDDLARADAIVWWCLKNMYCSRTGWFYYQRHQLLVNRVVYLRWTQAWTYLALSVYCREREHLASTL